MCECALKPRAPTDEEIRSYLNKCGFVLVSVQDAIAGRVTTDTSLKSQGKPRLARKGSPWFGRIEAYLADRSTERLTVRDVLDGAIGGAGDWTHRDMVHAVSALLQLGWVRVQLRDGANGKRRWAYEQG